MPKKILIVDDEEDMRIYLETLLRKAGYEIELAINGEEAFEKLKEARPDLITLDILMPKKSGLNFFKAIRQSDESADIPILVVSGISGHSEFFDEHAKSSPTVFVEKPIVPDTFLSQVKQLIGD